MHLPRLLFLCRRWLTPFLASAVVGAAQAASDAGPAPRALPSVRVHADGHYLETTDGKPFFWMGDTAWALIHATTREECSYYLRTRAYQGYNVIQAVVLAEMNGVRSASALGERPFIDDDPSRPNEAFFNRVVEVVDEANALGLYVALLPAWGDKLTAPWGDGPRLFRLDNLPVVRAYGRYLGAKLKGRTNVIWMLGGDRPARVDANRRDEYPHRQAEEAGFAPGYDWRPIWREMVVGITEGTGTKPVFMYHPTGGPYSTSQMLPDEDWLAIHGMQSGHGGGHDQPVWEFVARDYALSPAKPTLDLEPNYEDHPVSPWPRWNPAEGWFRDHDVRKQCYRSVFAGACGVTYGHHAVWGFVGQRNDVINHADRDWIDALHRPGAVQMRFLRALVESRPFFSRIPDPQLVTGPACGRALQAVACRDRDGTYAFVYVPTSDQTITVDLSRLKPGTLRAWWFDPRTGFAHPLGEFAGGGTKEFQTPGYGPDWVLVLDSAAAKFAVPGVAAN